jgi:hypothetical protein
VDIVGEMWQHRSGKDGDRGSGGDYIVRVYRVQVRMSMVVRLVCRVVVWLKGFNRVRM